MNDTFGCMRTALGFYIRKYAYNRFINGTYIVILCCKFRIECLEKRFLVVILLWFLTVLAVCVYTLVHLLC